MVQNLKQRMTMCKIKSKFKIGESVFIVEDSTLDEDVGEIYVVSRLLEIYNIIEFNGVCYCLESADKGRATYAWESDHNIFKTSEKAQQYCTQQNIKLLKEQYEKSIS